MKKLYLVFLAAVFLFAFCNPATAAEVKFFGDFYVFGIYENDHSLKGGTPSNDPSGVSAYGQWTPKYRIK